MWSKPCPVAPTAFLPLFPSTSMWGERRTLATAGQNPVVPIASLYPYLIPHPSRLPPKTPQIPPWVTRGKFLFCPLPFLGEYACVCQFLSRSDHRRRRVYAWKDTRTHTHTLSYIDIEYLTQYLGRNEFSNAKDNEFNSAAISLLWHPPAMLCSGQINVAGIRRR